MLRRLAARLALAFASAALVAVAFELGLRALGYGALYDVYSKPEIFWVHDDLLGWRHDRGVSGRYVGPRPFPVEFDAEVEINSLGMRGPEIAPRPPDGVRILFLGDSVVAGFEVPYAQTFAHLAGVHLSERLGVPVQTLNGAVRGYGTDQSYLWYRERGKGLQPDWVVFVHSLNDPTDNMELHRMRRLFGKGAFALRADGSLELLGTPVPEYPLCSHWRLDERYVPTRMDGVAQRAYCAVELSLSDRSALFSLAAMRLAQHKPVLEAIWYWAVPARKAAQRARDAGGRALAAAGRALGPRAAAAQAATLQAGARSASASERLTSALLVALAREVRTSGARLLIVIRDTELARMDTHALRIEGAIARTIYMDPARAAGRRVTFVNDNHYTALGHELTGRALADALAPLVRRVDSANAPAAPTPAATPRGEASQEGASR